ncbi:flagellar basal body rod C-terminal domain-containing protein [Teichococcus cervicalis]|uniref:flagellar basal body rod C-terminal domain-containing protein n=1 Tax=Teichococcus cervicalis TaxID=204525 RepID=UPI0038CD8D55
MAAQAREAAREATPEDPAAQQVALMLAQRGYEANLAVLRSTEQMGDRLLDMLG